MYFNIAVSVVGIAARYGLDGLGIESRWGWNFTHSSRPTVGPHPASYTMGAGSFPGVMRPGRGVDHPPPSSAVVEETAQLYLYFPSRSSWPVTGWTYIIYLLLLYSVRGLNPGEGEIFRTCPDRPWGPPSLLYNGYRLSSPGVKRPGRGVDHPPPSSADVKERVGLYLYSTSGPSWPDLGCTLPLRLSIIIWVY